MLRTRVISNEPNAFSISLFYVQEVGLSLRYIFLTRFYSEKNGGNNLISFVLSIRFFVFGHEPVPEI